MDSTVSVIIPVYNGAEYLEQCLSSIRDQITKPSQILVIDDGSTDHSRFVAQAFDEVEYHYQENQGVATSRNFGLKKATGEFIAFIDQDDFWTVESLKNRLDFFKINSQAKVVIGKQNWFLDGLDERPSWVKPEQMSEDLNGFLLGCALLRRSLFDEFGMFDTSFRFCSDFDWFFRLKDSGVKFHQVDQVILNKRIHSLNESRHAEQSLKELSRAIFHSIKRKNKRNEEG